MGYSNHVDEISYFLRLCQMYIKSFVGHSLKMDFLKKAEKCLCYDFLIIF